MSKKQHPPVPPWVHDPQPYLWVSLSVAARFYFRKSLSTLYRYVEDGTLDRVGMPHYFDGTRHMVRLPAPIQIPRARQPRQTLRATA